MADYRYPALVILGVAYTGYTGTLGYRQVDLSGTVITSFTTSGILETSVSGDYIVRGGMPVPEGFSGLIQWGTSSSGPWLAEEILTPVLYESLSNLETTFITEGLYRVTFTAVDSHSAALPRTLITLWNTTGTRIAWGYTDSTGSLVRVLTVGSYLVCADAGALYEPVLDQALSVGSEDIQVDLVLANAEGAAPGNTILVPPATDHPFIPTRTVGGGTGNIGVGRDPFCPRRAP